MGSLDEKKFYEALGVVPDVSPAVLENVERTVRQSGVKRRIAVAACLLLALIIPALLGVSLFTRDGNPSVAYAGDSEAMDELFYAFEFMSGGLDDAGQLFDIDSGAEEGGRLSSAPEEVSESTTVKTIAKKGDGQ